MLTQGWIKRLYHLAKQKAHAEAASESRNWAQPLNDWYPGPELCDLAKGVLGDKRLKHAAEVLLTFFTPKACKLLRTMPNKYWFWVMIRDATEPLWLVQNTGSENRNRIGLEPILHAIRAKRGCMARLINLEQTLQELTSEDLLLRMAHGIILIKLEENHPVPVINPIFAPTSH